MYQSSRCWWLLLLACAACQSPPVPSSTVSPGTTAVAWTQTSGEHRALTLQAFRLARERVEQALAEPAWSADVQQILAGGFEQLPPAVILDVDETVLDNSPYQARLVRDNALHSSDRWASWVEEAAAEPLQGAPEFTNWARARGIEVFYVTNREADQEAATRRNLVEAGFPVGDHEDAVLTRGELEGGSDKAPRRARVARDYRILLLVGDDLNDFVSGTRTDRETRNDVMLEYGDLWGRKWIVIPNPMYGGWERALSGDAMADDATDVIIDKLETRQGGQ